MYAEDWACHGLHADRTEILLWYLGVACIHVCCGVLYYEKDYCQHTIHSERPHRIRLVRLNLRSRYLRAFPETKDIEFYLYSLKALCCCI